MSYLYELHLTGDNLTTTDWQQLHAAIIHKAGGLVPYTITFSCHHNTVRFYVGCDVAIGELASDVSSIILRPVEAQEMPPPRASRREKSVRLVGGENLLDLKQRHAMKYGRDLLYAAFQVQPLGRLATLTRITFYFCSPTGLWSSAQKLAAVLPASLLQVQLNNHSSYKKQSVPRYLDSSKSLPLLSSEASGALFRVETFPYSSHQRYLHLAAFDFDRHSLIVGASGSGKSQLISLLVNRLSATMLNLKYRVVVIDPHASLASDFAGIPSRRNVTFGAEDGAELFPGSETDLASAVELTATLFRSILEDQFNPRLDRLLRFSLFCLMTAQTMSLQHLKQFLTNAQYRAGIMTHVANFIPDNVYKFFGTDFNELRSQYYEITIMPLVTMVDEMQLQPSLVGSSETSLARLVSENFLTTFSLNRISMGDKTLKTIAGLLIQQIFLLAQSRQFDQKIILIIDEVSVIQNPALAQILAEARKFNLSIILSQQYFGQVDQSLRDAIFANAYNYYIFKVSETDAMALQGNVVMDIPKALLASEQSNGASSAQIKARMMIELSPRQCLVRLMARGQLYPCFMARTADAPQASLHVAQRTKSAAQRLPAKYVEAEGQAVVSATPTVIEPPPAVSGQAPDGLGDLLRQHSSSRQNIKDRK